MIFATVRSKREFLLAIDEQVVIKYKRLINKFENICGVKASRQWLKQITARDILNMWKHNFQTLSNDN